MDEEKKDIVKQEEHAVAEVLSSIGDIIDNQQMKDCLDVMFKDCDSHKEEAMDAYFIIKDMVTNGGDFESSQSAKEQLAQLLKVANEANDSKIRLFETMVRTKLRTQPQQVNQKFEQNNFFGGDRRTLIKAVEELQQDPSFAHTNEDVAESFVDEVKIEEKIEDVIVNTEDKNEEKEFAQFDLQSGDF